MATTWAVHFWITLRDCGRRTATSCAARAKALRSLRGRNWAMQYAAPSYTACLSLSRQYGPRATLARVSIVALGQRPSHHRTGLIIGEQLSRRLGRGLLNEIGLSWDSAFLAESVELI